MIEIIKIETQKNVTDLVALAREIWTEHFAPIIGKAQVDYMLGKFQSKPAINAQLRRGYEYYLLTEDGLNKGYTAIVPDRNADQLMVSKLYVSKSARGRGFGRTLLNFSEEICRERNISTLWLTCNKNNADSVNWYIQMGFKNTGSIIMDIGEGFIMDDYRMEKTVVQHALP